MSTDNGRDVVVAYPDAVGRLDLPATEATSAEDVELVLPHAPPGFPEFSSGRAAAVQVCPEGLTDPVRFSDRRIDAFEGRPGGRVAESTSDTRVLTTGRPHRDTCISRVSIRDGRITRLAEFSDPIVPVTALGLEVPTS